MQRLTGKQAAFADMVSNGFAKSEAYRRAYDASSMADQTVWTEATKLAANPKVAARVQFLVGEKEAVRRNLVLDQEEAILAQLQHEAFTAKADSARIRALELLGRHAGMFAERVEVERVDRTAAQIEADVRVRLERLGILAQDRSSDGQKFR